MRAIESGERGQQAVPTWILHHDQQMPVVGHRLDAIEHEVLQDGVGGFPEGVRQRVVHLSTQLEGLLRRSPSATVLERSHLRTETRRVARKSVREARQRRRPRDARVALLADQGRFRPPRSVQPREDRRADTAMQMVRMVGSG